MADEQKEPLSWRAKFDLDQIEKNAAELRQELTRLERALDARTGVVQQFKPYPLYNVAHRTCVTSYPSPEAAKRAAEEAYKESLPLVDENKSILQSNTEILRRLITVITNAGLPESVSVRKSVRGHKTVSVDTDWREALRQHIPILDGWQPLESFYREWLRRCDEWQQKLDNEKRQKEASRQAEVNRIQKAAFIMNIADRYGMSPDCDSRDLLQAIIKTNKYLWLAHYLEANRSDWSEGCDYAQTGLNGFKVETDIDRQVSEELWGLCNDWDGDGRVFRDCTWNYGRLYQMASEQAPQAMQDYTKLAEAS